MLMTEEEAKKKRCTPAMIILLLDPETKNGMAASGARVSGNCIGSACAQWTWYDYANEQGETFHNPGAEKFHKGRATLPSDRKTLKPSPARGYCGLTGSKS